MTTQARAIGIHGPRWIDRDILADLKALYRQRHLAWLLYLAGIAEQRRGSGLGLYAPFVSVLLQVVLLGSVMSLVLGEETHAFIPFFAVSFSLWQGFSSAVSTSANANERAIRYLLFPHVSGYIVHLIDAYEYAIALVLKLLASGLIILAVNPSILLGAHYGAFILGLLLSSLTLFVWALPLAYVFDKVRLLRGFLPQMMFALFLITPIFWQPERLAGHPWLILGNPVYHFIEVARAPLLQGTVPWISIGAVLALMAVGAALTAALHRKNRGIMVYRWVA
jgi:lipopolysaccharide transport system permease protein